jgi:hypothetical protein
MTDRSPTGRTREELVIAAPVRGSGSSRSLAALRLAGLLAALVLLAGISAGCRTKPPASSNANEKLFRGIALTQLQADSVFNMRDTLKLVRGTWRSPASTAGFEAYRDSATYRFIEEREDRGELGESDNRYYFDSNGALFYYEDRGEEKEPRGALPPMSRLVQRTLIFAPDGRPTWGRRLVDGVAGVVPDSESVAIAERSRGLLAHVRGLIP